MVRSLRRPDAQQRQGRIAYQAELSIGSKSKPDPVAVRHWEAIGCLLDGLTGFASLGK